jgi:hypothetical protein
MLIHQGTKKMHKEFLGHLHMLGFDPGKSP